MALSLEKAGIRAQPLTLSGRSRSPSFGASDQIKRVDITSSLRSLPRYQVSSSSISLSANKTDDDDDMESLASYVTASVDEFIKHGSRPLPLVYGSEVYVNSDTDFGSYEEDIRVDIMNRVASALRRYPGRYPGADPIQIYHAKIYYYSMSVESDDIDKDLTKSDVMITVCDVVDCFPKVTSKVTEETHFINDLGFDKWDLIDVIQALQVEFKLFIPYNIDIVSCKLAIDYIYDHQSERFSREEFRKHFCITQEFGESKSEFRRIFLPGVERRRNYTMDELYCQMSMMKGFNPFMFFMNMRESFYWD